MQKQIWVGIVFLLGISMLNAQQGSTLSDVVYFGDNLGNLNMHYFRPDSLPDAPVPLVVVLHGCGQKAEDIASLTGWNKLAKLHGFMVLYPEQKLANNLNLCFNWFNETDSNRGEGEVASIQQMIRYSTQNWNIDTSRIFSVGFSAGGAMSVAMLASYPDVFEAGAAFAGGPFQLATNWKEGAKAMLGNLELPSAELVRRVKKQVPNFTQDYPKLIVYQGLNDHIVAPKSSYILVNQWLGLSTPPLQKQEVEFPLEKSKQIRRTCYTDAANKERIVFYEIESLGHRVLIDPGSKPEQGGQPGLFTEQIGFHSTFQTAVDFGLIPNAK